MAMWRAAFAVFAFLVLAVPAMAAPTFPALTGRVVDAANIIPDDVEASLSVKLAELETKTTDQMVVVTLPSLQGYDIADYGYQLGRHWQIGQKDRNNGVLLIVAPEERTVRFEVGYGLEGTLTDAYTRVIIENAILPRFRENDYAGGIERGVEHTILLLASGEAPPAAKKRSADNEILYALLPFMVFAALILLAYALDDGRGGGRGSARRRGGFIGGMGGSSWSSGGSSWSGGGGGFSGGGGSFGGGGSSGRW